MAEDPAFKAHQEWIRPLGGEGLVVSATALTDAMVYLPPDDRLKELSAQFEETLFIAKEDSGEERVDLPLFEKLTGLLGWGDDEVVWDHKEVRVPDELSITVDGTTIKPTHVLLDSQGAPAVLVIQLSGSPDLLQRTREGAGDWDASPAQRMERLLREKKVEIGIIITATEIRLFYVPAAGGENPGSISLPLSEMRGVRGRPTLGAVFMLLERSRVVGENIPEAHRLLGLMRASREAQNRVSEELADQVLGALYELIKGLQVADQAAHRKLISKYLNEHPEEVYHGLLNVLMRLIFMLYAEDRGIMPQGGLWQENYEVHGLFERLQRDNVQHAGNMDKRYGAWGQLLTTFKVVHDGCRHPSMRMPARMGYLFDPRRYPFVSADSDGNVPLVSDAVVLFILKSLLVVKGERISYRSLNVENIGVVYETMMGFSIYQSKGSCLVLKGPEAPVAVELDELMSGPSSSRAQVIADMTGWKPNAKAAKAIKDARDKNELRIAMEDRIRDDITPTPLAAGGLTLQPGEERRRSGSHYTPRALTEPLVFKAFEPHFMRFGEQPMPEQILSLTVCDPAMGSGAFLVEATRQLAAKLVEAWKRDKDKMPKLGAGDDIEFVALRTVAQRCIYGVDRNPMAVDLAKLSLWLLTISKDHPFTFMDHSLKHGDALVGMSKEQIKKFHWDLSKGGSILPEMRVLDKEVEEAVQARLDLRNLDADQTLDLVCKLAEANDKMEKARHAGDLLVYAWFSDNKDKARNEARDRYADQLSDAIKQGSLERKTIEQLRYATKPLAPFHWELEFPEVFKCGGFSSFVGNPPFIGGKNISGGACEYYLDYLKDRWGHVGQSDIIADFFVSAFSRLNKQGTAAFISTITITQGDTKKASLEKIMSDGGVIYSAKTNMDWPGKAAVMVHLLCYSRNAPGVPLILDGRSVSSIDAQLMEGEAGGHPSAIQGQDEMYKRGFEYGGEGFVFEDNSAKSTPTSVAIELMKDARNAAFMHPLIGGSELLSDAAFEPNRWVIDFGSMDLDQAEKASPGLIKVLREKVYLERQKQKREKTRRLWWLHKESSVGLRSMMQSKKRLLVHPYTSTYLCFLFVPTSIYVAAPHFVFDFDDFATFAVLQGIVHESWVRRFGGKRKSDLSYTATDCFANFPFPVGLKSNTKLEEAGRAYYELRDSLAKKSGLGFTEVYHEFYDGASDMVGINELRDAHLVMSYEALMAYGLNALADEVAAGSVERLKSPEFQARVVKALLPIHAQRVTHAELAVSARPTLRKSNKPKKPQDAPGPDLFNV